MWKRNGLIDTVEGVLEECDDQNTFSYDGCDSNWRKEAGFEQELSPVDLN